ncbi:MAG: alpha/beta hydrolase fold domain-containing protein [Bacteroidales bacterium]|nr:alpha/beta hydrolase fold domain-containing protein [Bacteroidales bacterium]
MARRRALAFLAFLLLGLTLAAQNYAGTYTVAQKDTCELCIDVYLPTVDSGKPSVLFVFGGGFVEGSRNDRYYLPWFKLLNENGYGVVSADYRLALKGKRMRFDFIHILQSAKAIKEAVDMGVEDVFSAVRYLIDNEVGINPYNLVIAGSSAGAMISLSCILETCNSSSRASILPDFFRFKGAMSFAGAIMSDFGVPEYKSTPPPQLLFHGIDDGAVAYDKIAFGRYGIYGSSALVRDVLSKHGYDYAIYRYVGHGHDIAAQLFATWPEQKLFLERNVAAGMHRTIDATIDDPSIPQMRKLNKLSVTDIY